MFKLVTLFLKKEPYEYQQDLNHEFINPAWNMILIPLLDIHYCHGVPWVIIQEIKMMIHIFSYIAVQKCYLYIPVWVDIWIYLYCFARVIYIFFSVLVHMIYVHLWKPMEIWLYRAQKRTILMHKICMYIAVYLQYFTIILHVFLLCVTIDKWFNQWKHCYMLWWNEPN